MRSKLFAVIVALTALAAFPAASSATQLIPWDKLESGSRLPGGDRVQVTYASLPNPDDVQFVFRRAPGVYWWKGVEVKDEYDNLSAFLEPGRDWVTIPHIDVDEGTVYLWKTGVFGLHIPAYRLRVSDTWCTAICRDLKGKRVTFTWLVEG